MMNFDTRLSLYTNIKSNLFIIKRCVFNIVSVSILIIGFSEILISQEKIEMIFPQEKKTILSEGLSMSYYKEGSGDQNILFIHGLGSNKKAWANIWPYLTTDFTLYAIDLPKYLETDDVSKIGMKKYADYLQVFMDKMNIDQAVICGHSMGGIVAIHFALANKERTEKLILLAPAGLEVFNEEEVKWFKTFVTKTYFLNQTDAQIKKNFDINFYKSEMPSSATFMLSDRMNLKRDTIRYDRYIDYIIACIQSMLGEPVYESLSQIDVPTLTVFGKNDLLIPNQILHPNLKVVDVLQNAKLINGAEILMVDHAGHFIQWDQPKLLSEKITQFIQIN